MSDLVNVMKKELRELLTPSSIISVMVVVLMFAMMGSAMSGEMEKATSPSHMLVVNCDSDTYGVESISAVYDSLYGTGMFTEYVTVDNSAVPVDSAYVEQRLNELGYTDAVVIAQGFHSNITSTPVVKGQVHLYFQYQSGGIFSGASSSIAATIMEVVNSEIAKTLVTGEPDLGPNAASPVDMGSTHTYVNGRVVDNVTPMMISSALMSQSMVVPIVIMVIIMMVGSIVISSMGNEKENKTLETLLTMPVKRMTIVTGKLLSAAIAGIVFGAAYMVGMMFYMNGMNSTIAAGVDLSDIGLTLGPMDWLAVMVMMFLAILTALGMCMILGAFTKNYKAAQTMTLPLAVLAMIPMFVLMFMGWESLPMFGKVLLFIIPFTHPMMVMNNLMFGNYALVLGGAVYLLAFTAVMIYATIRIYKSDILITGIGQTKFAVTLKKMVTKKAQ